MPRFLPIEPSTPIIAGMHVNPAAALGKIGHVAVEEMGPGVGAAFAIPQQRFAREPGSAAWSYRTIDTVNKLLNDLAPDLIKKHAKILEDLPEGADGEFVRAFNGLVPDADGNLTQMAAGEVSPEVSAIAKRYYGAVHRKLLWRTRGVRPEVGAIIEQDLVPDFTTTNYNPEVLKRLKSIQNLEAAGEEQIPGQSPFSAQEIVTARKLGPQIAPDGNIIEGKLSFDKTYDLSDNPFDTDFFGSHPVKGEQRKLAGDIRELKERIVLSSQDPNSARQLLGQIEQTPDPIAQQALVGQLSGYLDNENVFWDSVALAAKKQRLDQIAGQMAERERSGSTATGLPAHQRYIPQELTKTKQDPNYIPKPGEEPFVPFETDPSAASAGQRQIMGSISKRMYDDMLGNAKSTFENGLVSRDMQTFMTNYINGQRGMKGFQEDVWIRGLAKSIQRFARKTLPEGRVKARLLDTQLSEEAIRGWTSDLLKVTSLLKLSLSPAFSAINSTQTILTMPGFVGTLRLAKAWGRVIGDAVSHRLGDTKVFNSISRARAAGVLSEAGERFLTEAEALSGGGTFSQVIDTLHKKYPFAVTAQLSEQFNRIVAHEAFFKHAMEDGFEPHKAVTTFNRDMSAYRNTDGTFNRVKMAKAYAKEGVRATQFILGKEGRPGAFVGGSLRRVVGQFRTYQVAYATMMKNLFVHDKAGFAKNATALWLLGGATAFPLYETLRTQMMKQGFVLPRDTGLAQIGNFIGAPLNLDVDVSDSLKALNLPESPDQIPGFLLGPSLGPIADTAYTASKFGLGATQTKRAAIRGFSPKLFGLGEAVFGGGQLTSRSGDIIAEPTGGQRVIRGLGLRPAFRKPYFQAQDDIYNAYMFERDDLVPRLVEEANRQGVFLSAGLVRSLRGRARSDRKKASEATFR